MSHRVRHRAAAALAALLAAGLLPACGRSDVDRNDETGVPPAVPDPGQTRVELVYVDAAQDTATPSTAPDTASAPAWQEAPPPPSAPLAAAAAAVADDAAAEETVGAMAVGDEAGGDDLIEFDPAGAFAVQVGTFADAATARRRVRELAALGYPAYSAAAPGGAAVRVRIGYFSTRDQADRFGQRYRRDHGGQYWVAQRKDEGRSP